MPDQLDEQVNRTVRRLLYDNWEPSNTAGYGPDTSHVDTTDELPVHFGNYNANVSDPQVSLAQPQGEFTLGGRWSGKNMQADEMNEFRRGVVLVQCWAESGTTYNGEGVEAIVSLLRHEVERVVGNHESGPTSGANSDLLWSFSSQWDGRFPDPQEEVAQPTWQSQIRVTYDWERSQ